MTTPSERGVLRQVVDAVSAGLVVLDADLVVRLWNRWMVEHSGLEVEDALGRRIDQLFPGLDVRTLRRKVRQVLALGNFAFYDVELQEYVLPFPLGDRVAALFDHMQQSAVLVPLTDGHGSAHAVCLSIIDQTSAMAAKRALQRANLALERASRTDGLTQMANRTHVLARISQQVEVARTHHHGAFSVLLLDVDHFKAINDRHGHLAGDEVLRQLGAVMTAAVRERDLVGRYGGEEFAVYLSDADPQTAMVVAERIRGAVEALEVTWNGRSVPITISVGSATFDPTIESADDLLHRADEALYRAKRAGRNQVCAA